MRLESPLPVRWSMIPISCADEPQVLWIPNKCTRWKFHKIFRRKLHHMTQSESCEVFKNHPNAGWQNNRNSARLIKRGGDSKHGLSAKRIGKKRDHVFGFSLSLKNRLKGRTGDLGSRRV